MTKLKISADLSLPEDTVTSTLIVYGGKGMGKTNLGSVLVEELTWARIRWCVLDPLGVWWGLRHSADGKGPGIECLILGGVHGDIPIEPSGGVVVADLVVDEDVDVVVDFSRHPSGKRWSKGDRIRFVTAYAVRLYERQGELVNGRPRPPIFQVLDEAARYIPQQVRHGDKEIALCVGAWEDLVEEGRNFGVGVGLLTQRSARMNKSVSELADAMFAFRTVGPLSIDAIMDWLGDHVPKDRVKELVEIVRSLDVGSALVVSPGWLRFEEVVGIRARQTFDSSATPKAGERQRQKVTGKAAQPDLGKYRERMAETIERAQEEDPRELKRRIAGLRKQLATRPADVQVQEVEKEIRVEVPIFRDGEVDRLTKAVGQLSDVGAQLVAVGQDVGTAAAEISSALKGAPQPAPRVQPRIERRPAPRTAPARPPPVARQVPPAEGDVQIKKGARRMLEVLVRHWPMRMTRAQLGTLARVKRTGGTFGDYFSKLKMSGFIEEEGGLVSITQAGQEFIGHVPAEPVSVEELREMYRSALKAGARRMLDILIEEDGNWISRQELADRAEITMSGGTFGDYLSSLRTNGLADVQGGMVRASETLFIGAGVA